MTIVETSTGRLEGSSIGGVHTFLGVPFAKPPVGDLRWRAPEPANPWTGTREAHHYGPCAIQSTLPGDVGRLIGIATHETSEDCLYLNVWTPGCDSGKRPVMVWIHGGGNTVGAGSQPRVEGARLAQTGDVVVVTINYRLGALGFLHAPELGATGNEALLDQTLALRWVREEIGNFGGDAGNVTVFGQSAGGFDIAQLMAMPAAAGCFDKAIPMSGSLTRQRDADSAHAAATAMADKFGGFEKLRAVPAEEIHAAQFSIPNASWGPTLDGSVLKEDAAEVLRRGDFTKDMPLLIGHTREESTLFVGMSAEGAEMSREQLLANVAGFHEQDADEFVATYESSLQDAGLSSRPIDVWSAISTDRMFRMPAIRTAECHLAHSDNVWMYRFDYPSPALDGRLKACHSLDIPFVFGTFDLSDMKRFCGEGEEVARLSEFVMSKYLAFARSGSPDAEATPRWPKYDLERRSTMTFDVEPAIESAPFDRVRRMWMDSS